MKRKFISILSLLLLCGCGTNNDIEIPETDTIASQITTTSAIELITSVSQATAVTQADEPTVLAEYSNDYYGMCELLFYGVTDENSLSSYNGTLKLHYKNDSTDFTFTIYENEEFFFSTQWTTEALNIDHKIIQLRYYDDNRQTVNRFFEIEADALQPLSIDFPDEYKALQIDDYTFAADEITLSTNQIIRDNNDGKSNGYYYYNFQNNRYDEYIFDCQNNAIQIIGSMPIIHNEEIEYAVKNHDIKNKIIDGHFSDNGFYDTLTYISQDNAADTTTYRVDQRYASSKAELLEYWKSAYSQKYINEHLSSVEERFYAVSPNGYTHYIDDSDGLIYIQYYDGVPNSYDYEKIRIVDFNQSSAQAIMLGNSPDEQLLSSVDLIFENNRWVVDNTDIKTCGHYFE